MGADLYITPLYDKQRARWEPELEEAERRLNSLKPGTDDFAQAYLRYAEVGERMKAQGYFRDSYNPWNLLRKFGLSWARDIMPMLDKEYRLPVQEVETLLEILEERESIFETNVETLPLKEEMYFRGKYSELRDFLNEAIELDIPIDTCL